MRTFSTPRPRKWAALAVSMLGAYAVPLAAHNASVHRDMTERAWEIMMALADNRLDIAPNDDIEELARAARSALSKYRALPAGLPAPKQSTCADPQVVNMVSSSPNWGAPADFKQLPLGQIRYPIKTTYITGNDCGIDPQWKPGAFFDTAVNPVGHRDLTGVVLGFWSHQPDDEEGDWHIFERVTNAGNMSAIKSFLQQAGGAALGTVWVPLSCIGKCIGSALGLGGSCKSCLSEALEDSKKGAHEAITTIDGLVPGIGDHTSLDLYTGMGHHINIAPASSFGVWKLNPQQYDNTPGLLMENAGPTGIPDPVEMLVIQSADAFGMSVHYEPSLGPDRYQIQNVFDFHPDSIARDENEWQWLSMAHTPFTPLDNLAMFGWQAFRERPREHVPFIGWALHGFGDAIVPMHVAGTFGWGHRPYEDAFEHRMPKYLEVENAAAARQQALEIVNRAINWRQFVRDWRSRHPQRGGDVPIRDMITELARRTSVQIDGPAKLTWPYNPGMSAVYLTPGLSATSLLFYEKAPGADAVNRSLIMEGIAAEMVFLICAAEFLP
jgi:hypothetical protein